MFWSKLGKLNRPEFSAWEPTPSGIYRGSGKGLRIPFLISKIRYHKKAVNWLFWLILWIYEYFRIIALPSRCFSRSSSLSLPLSSERLEQEQAILVLEDSPVAARVTIPKLLVPVLFTGAEFSVCRSLLILSLTGQIISSRYTIIRGINEKSLRSKWGFCPLLYKC